MNKTPKLSILTITYNHEKYIRDTIESFLMQKTDFDFEIVIADDCSTDDTPKIIEEYKKNFSDKFRPILRKNNLGAWQNMADAMRSARGQYIAVCEGDDYWTDPHKLQRQVDFLDKHKDYGLCFHPVKVIFDNNEEKESVYPTTKDTTKFTIKELLQHNFIQTNSVVYRRQNYYDLPDNILPGDIYLNLYHARFGKIGFIDKVMSVYRRHPGGIWWDSYNSENKLWEKYALPHLALFVALRELYNDKPEYKSIIDNSIDNMFNKIIVLDKKYKKNQLIQVIDDYPQATDEFIMRQYKGLQLTTKKLQNKDQDILYSERKVNDLQQLVNDLEHQIKLRDQEINMIKASRVWKARNKVAKKIGRKEI